MNPGDPCEACGEPMNFTIAVHTDNEAFDPDPAPELVRILRKIADRVEREGFSGFFETIHDVNGNDLGRYAMKPAERA